jgi:hypothetical protein
MGTEIRTFDSIKEIMEFLANQILQYKSLYDDYSQWLGTLLRDFAPNHKNDEWYQKIASLQKLSNQSKKPQEKSEKGKNSKGKNTSPAWVQTCGIDISFTEEGQTQILFEAIEKINSKIQEYDKFKVAVQQLSRLGLGANVSYLVFFEDDSPKKIVLKSKANAKGDDIFKFVAELSVPAFYRFDAP